MSEKPAAPAAVPAPEAEVTPAAAPAEVQSKPSAATLKTEGSSDSVVDEKDAGAAERGVVGVAQSEPHIPLSAYIAVFFALITNFGLIFAIQVYGVQARNVGLALGGDALQKSTWLQNGFNLAVVAFGPPVALTADIYGRKYVMTGCLLVGIIGAFVGTFKADDSMNLAILAATMTGVAGSLQGVSNAIAAEVMPRKYRPWVFFAVAVSSVLAAVVCLAGTGAAVRDDPARGWLWLFRILIIVYGIQIPYWAFFYRPPPRNFHLLTAEQQSIDKWTRFKNLDWIGFFLFPAGITLFLFGIVSGENPWPWKDAKVLSPLLVGVLVLVVFGLWEWKGRSDGLFHHGLFSVNRNYAICCVGFFAEGCVFLIYSANYPAEVSLVFNHDQLYSNLYHLPYHLGFLVGTFLGAAIIRRTGMFKEVIIFGYLLTCVAAGVMIAVRPGLKWRNVFMGMDALVGFGLCLPLQFITPTAQLNTPPGLIGIATANGLTLRAIGGGVAVSIAAALKNDKIKTRLAPYIARAVLPLGVAQADVGKVISAISSGSPTAIAALIQNRVASPAAIGAASHAAQRAWAETFQYVWIVVVAFTGAALFAVCFLIPAKHLYQSNSTDAPMEAKSKDTIEAAH